MDANTLALIITIIGTGVALALVIVPGQRELRRDIADLRERMATLEGRMMGVEARMSGVESMLVSAFGLHKATGKS